MEDGINVEGNILGVKPKIVGTIITTESKTEEAFLAMESKRREM